MMATAPFIVVVVVAVFGFAFVNRSIVIASAIVTAFVRVLAVSLTYCPLQ